MKGLGFLAGSERGSVEVLCGFYCLGWGFWECCCLFVIKGVLQGFHGRVQGLNLGLEFVELGFWSVSCTG